MPKFIINSGNANKNNKVTIIPDCQNLLTLIIPSVALGVKQQMGLSYIAVGNVNQ